MIQIDTTALREAQRHLQEVKKKTKVAMYRALNRVAQNAKTNASKEIREQYVIKAGDLGSTFSIKKADKGSLSATIRSRSRGTGLDKYKFSPRRTTGKRPKVLKVAVKKGGMKKVPGAFVAEKNGVKIFIREGRSRLPIKRLYGPPAPEMFNNVQIRESVERKARVLYAQRLEHELNRELGG
ncbi:phage tail protein [Paenibacillus sp. FSL P2-0173]|uniref:phage tail protein n=1 Tax=Paenibacillus sp. FSL P2-0173 TaxID=2921627 RepID=UPI0030F9D626